jgi:hypothetical protein
MIVPPERCSDCRGVSTPRQQCPVVHLVRTFEHQAMIGRRRVELAEPSPRVIDLTYMLNRRLPLDSHLDGQVDSIVVDTFASAYGGPDLAKAPGLWLSLRWTALAYVLDCRGWPKMS